MEKESMIEQYIAENEFKDDKMFTYIFRGLAQAKEASTERVLSIQDLNKFRENLH